MNGITWPSLHAWAERTGRNPLPHEIDGLFALDAVMRSPEEKG